MKYEIFIQRRHLGEILSPSVFDATLLVGYVTEHNQDNGIFVFGDGCVVMENGNNFVVREIEFETNAPYYLSYLLDDQRKLQYEKEFGHGEKIVTTTIISKISNEIKVEKSVLNYDDGVVFTFDYLGEKYNKITLMTDGVHTFTENNRFESCVQMARDITNYKSCCGEFIKKSWNVFKRLHKNTNHQDDIGIAGILIKEEDNA